MPTANDIIIHGLLASQSMLEGLVADLSPQEHLHRPTPKSNCAAWLLGHLTLTERAVLQSYDVPLPPLPEGFEARFGRDEAAAMSNDFGDVTTLLPLFKSHRALLVETMRNASGEKLDTPWPKPHPRFKTLGERTNYIGCAHVALHAGQISIIRRSLGRPPLV